MTTYNGNIVDGVWSANMDISVYETPTYVEIQFGDCWFDGSHSYNAGQRINAGTFTARISGPGVYESTTKTIGRNTLREVMDLPHRTARINKTTSIQTVTFMFVLETSQWSIYNYNYGTVSERLYGQSMASVTITVPALAKPNVSMTAERSSTDNTTIEVNVEVSSFSGDNISQIKLTVGGVDEYLDTGTISTTGKLTRTARFTDQSQGAVDCSVVATGKGGQSSVYSLKAPSAFFTMDIGGGGKSIAFGGQASDTSLPANGRMDIFMELFLKGKSLLDAIYPVGSIYMSTNDVSPQQFLGGTWEAIHGRFLLASGANDGNDAGADTYWGTSFPVGTLNAPAGEKGGEAWHKLTVAQIPSHNHSIPSVLGYKSGANDKNGGSSKGNWTAMTASGYAGGGSAHNNLPPYLAVYMWKRTA